MRLGLRNVKRSIERPPRGATLRSSGQNADLVRRSCDAAAARQRGLTESPDRASAHTRPASRRRASNQRWLPGEKRGGTTAVHRWRSEQHSRGESSYRHAIGREIQYQETNGGRSPQVPTWPGRRQRCLRELIIQSVVQCWPGPTWRDDRRPRTRLTGRLPSGVWTTAASNRLIGSSDTQLASADHRWRQQPRTPTVRRCRPTTDHRAWSAAHGLRGTETSIRDLNTLAITIFQ